MVLMRDWGKVCLSSVVVSFFAGPMSVAIGLGAMGGGIIGRRRRLSIEVFLAEGLYEEMQ